MKNIKSFAVILLALFLIPLMSDFLAQEKLDETPVPVGGMSAISKNIKYPEEAKKAGEQGTVFVKAVISEKGDVVSTEVVESVSELLDEAAVKAVKATKFTAGIKNGKAVQCEVTIPIKFKLS